MRITEDWLKYCHTEKQAEAVLARLSLDTKQAAEQIGIHPEKLRERIARVRRNIEGGIPGNLPGGLELDRITQHIRVDDGQGTVKNIWLKGKNYDLPDPKKIAKEIAEAIKAEIKPTKPKKPPRRVDDMRMLCIPVSDAHIGLYAHHSDAGGDFDLHIAKSHYHTAIRYLLNQTSNVKEILLEFLGDYFHANDHTNETPKSKHRLDVDSRRFKVITTGMAIAVDMIDQALKKSETVCINWVPGNHDPDASQWAIAYLQAWYRNEPRVLINDSQQPMLFHRFGNNLIGVTHGDKIKFEKMAETLATDSPDWSACKYREVHSGHIHTNKSNEKMLCEVQSFRILAPGDYYAQSHGYRSGCEIVALEYDFEYGQINRYRAPLALIQDLA